MNKSLTIKQSNESGVLKWEFLSSMKLNIEMYALLIFSNSDFLEDIRNQLAEYVSEFFRSEIPFNEESFLLGIQELMREAPTSVASKFLNSSNEPSLRDYEIFLDNKVVLVHFRL